MKSREKPINASYDDSTYKYKYEAADMSNSVTSCDLHDINDIDTAISEMEKFIDREFREGSDDIIKIIHGKGTGKLRRAVHESLNQSPLVEEYMDTIDSRHLGAITHVLLVER